MHKDLKTILKEKMKERKIKTPALAAALQIPVDRIYAWYRDNTNPKGEDSERIRKWLDDPDYNEKYEENSNLGSENRFTAEQLFAMFMEVSGKQTAILQSIENKMAREDTLADVKTNSIELLAGVRSLSRRQKDAIKQMQRDLAELKSQKDHPSEGSGKSLDQNGGGEKKSGKRG